MAGGQDLAGPQVALAAEVEVLQLVADAFQLGHGLEDLHAFGRHFRAGAVAADDGDPEDVVAAHDGASVSARGECGRTIAAIRLLLNGLRAVLQSPAGGETCEPRSGKMGRGRRAQFLLKPTALAIGDLAGPTDS